MIQSLREYVATCPHLDSLTDDIHVDWMKKDDPADFGIFNGGDRKLSEDMAGNARRQITVYVQTSQYMMNDLVRLENSDLIEDIQNWVNDNAHSPFPLPQNIDFEYIEAGEGTPIDVSGDGQAFVYRIPINLYYERMK